MGGPADRKTGSTLRPGPPPGSDTGAGFPHTDIEGAKGTEGVIAFLRRLHGPLRAEVGRARCGVRRWLCTPAPAPGREAGDGGHVVNVDLGRGGRVGAHQGEAALRCLRRIDASGGRQHTEDAHGMCVSLAAMRLEACGWRTDTATLRYARGDLAADVSATLPHVVALVRLGLDGWPPCWPGDS